MTSHVTNPVATCVRYALMHSHLAVWADKHPGFRGMAKRSRKQAKQFLKDARRLKVELRA